MIFHMLEINYNFISIKKKSSYAGLVSACRYYIIVQNNFVFFSFYKRILKFLNVSYHNQIGLS